MVKRNRVTGALSMNPLVQSLFQEFLGTVRRQTAHQMTSKLVYRAFPMRAAHLHDKWDRCRLYAPHVLALRDAIKKEQGQKLGFAASREFCEVATTCARYDTNYSPCFFLSR